MTTLLLGLLAPAAGIAGCPRQRTLTPAGSSQLTEIFRRHFAPGTPATLTEDERDLADGWPIAAALLYRSSRTYLVLFRSDPATRRTVAAFYWVEPVGGWSEDFSFLAVEASSAYWTPRPTASTPLGQFQPGIGEEVATVTRGILLRGYLHDGFPHPWLVLVWSSGGPGASKIPTAHPMIHVDPIVDCVGLSARLGEPVSGSALERSDRAKP